MAAPTASVWRAGLATAGIAALADLATLLVGRAFGVSFVVRFSGTPLNVGVAIVLLMSVVPVLLGTAAAVLACSRGRRGLTLLQFVGAALAVVSVAAGPMATVAPTATKLVLASMHLVAGAAFVLALQYVKASWPVAPDAIPAGGAREAR
jgi:hypothetical protein